MVSAVSVSVTTILPGSPPKGVAGGWIAITIAKAVILLTPEELTQGLKRGKSWTRHQQLQARHQAEAER